MKRRQRIATAAIATTMACLCLLGSAAQARAAVASAAKSGKDPDIRSNSALVLDMSDASVLYERHPDTPGPIASITKLMAALVVLDGKQPLEEMIEITKADRRHGRGSRLPAGARISRADLLHLALMSSENCAAHALGRTYPGGLDEFVRTMNMKAKILGMTRTAFADPSGLSSDNVASPRDLTKLVIAAERSGIIREYSTSKSHAVRIGRRMTEFHNTNTLVSKPDWTVAVQKTGYTNEAGHCLVMQALIEDRPIVIVLLNSFGKYTRVADARRIRRWMEAGEGTRSAGTVAAFPTR